MVFLTMLLVHIGHFVDIALKDICGNKLVGSCPDKISLKVIGGQSSCAEKVPWNVLVELTSGPQLQAAGTQKVQNCLMGPFWASCVSERCY